MFRWLHTIGALFILISAILLLVTTISAPVIGDIAIMKVMLTNQTDIRHSSLTFGTFGHCALDVPPVNTDQDWCSKKTIGYKVADIMSQVDGTNFNLASTDSTNGLTNAFILHPIACGLAFIAAIFAFGGFFGSIVGVIIAILAWIVTVVVMAIDFTVFGIIKNHVNKDGSGNHAYYDVGMWTCLAAMILLLFGVIIVFFTCCTDRKKRSRGYADGTTEKRHSHRSSRRSHRHSRHSDTYVDNGYSNGTTGRRSYF